MGATQRRRRQHLQRRSGTWYYLRRVPADLVSKLGRDEITRSLGTATYRRACSAAALLDGGVERLIRAIRKAVELAREDVIEQLCERFYRKVREQDRQDR